jgi:hypothetical protein
MRYIIILLAILLGTGLFVVDKFLLQDNNDKISDQNIPKPNDFVQIRRDIQTGIFYDLDNLTKNYYLQPDFYPSYKLSGTHDYSRWGVHGYGAFPGETSYNIDNFTKDQFINIYTFVKAGDDIETFQGMKFDVDFVNSNKSLFIASISPDTIMFSPTFPERSEYSIENRTYDWVYKLKITLAANVDIPPGKYEFKLIALPPEENVQKLYYTDIQKINQQWYKCPDDKKVNCDENTVELRKKVYVNGGQFQADKFFDIIINVGNG